MCPVQVDDLVFGLDWPTCRKVAWNDQTYKLSNHTYDA